MPLYEPVISALAGGTTKATGPSVSFADANGVSFGVTGNTVTASVAPSGGGVALSAGTQSGNTGTVVFANSNGVSFGMSNNTQITASVDGIKSISGGTTRATNGEVVFADANGVSFGVNGNTVTASMSVDGIKSISGGTTRATNGEVVFADSNGVSFGVNGNTVTVSNDAVRLVSIGTNTASGSNLVFSNSGGVTFGLSGSTVTAKADPGMSFFPLYPLIGTGTGAVSLPVATSAAMSIYGFTLDRPMVTGISLGVIFSASYITRGTSAGSASLGCSLGLFSMGAGTASTQASQITSWSFGISDSYSNSTLTINYPGATASSGFGTASNTSNGLNITQLHTGLRRINYELPSSVTLTPGHYFLAFIGTQLSSSNSGGARASVYGMSHTLSNIAPYGVNNYTTGSRVLQYRGPLYPYIGIWTSAGLTSLPASFAVTDMTLSGLPVPYAALFAAPS